MDVLLDVLRGMAALLANPQSALPCERCCLVVVGFAKSGTCEVPPACFGPPIAPLNRRQPLNRHLEHGLAAAFVEIVLGSLLGQSVCVALASQCTPLSSC